jgi:hypothetical protein
MCTDGPNAPDDANRGAATDVGYNISHDAVLVTVTAVCVLFGVGIAVSETLII